MAIAAAVFAVIAYFYKEYQPSHEDTEDQELILDKNSAESDQILQ